MNSSVLITGARGFIGRNLVRSLTEDGVTVREPGRPNEIEAGLDDSPSCDHVIHLAAKSYIPDSWTSPALFYKTNFFGTVQVLEYCRRVGASLTLVSSYLYGTPSSLPTNEEEPLRPSSPYAHSKFLAEDVVRFYGLHFNLDFTIVRPFNIYGPGQPERALIPELIRKYLDPAVPEIAIRDPHPLRDFLYVDDLVDLLKRTMRSAATETFNAGSGVVHSPEDVARQIGESLGIQKPLRALGEVRRNEIPVAQADITKARQLLGWEPRVSFAQGIAMTAASLADGER